MLIADRCQKFQRFLASAPPAQTVPAGEELLLVDGVQLVLLETNCTGFPCAEWNSGRDWANRVSHRHLTPAAN